MLIKRSAVFEEIFSVMMDCRESFYDQRYNDQNVILRLADKFSNNADFVSIYIDKKVAGFISYYANNYETKTAFISMIIVKKEFSKRGIGTKLLEYACKESIKRGMENISLEVDFKNANAISFYFKNNFHQEVSKKDGMLYLTKKLESEQLE